MSRLARDANAAPIQCLRPSTTYTVTVGVESTSIPAITQRIVRIAATQPLHFKLNAAATTSDCYLPAGAVEFIHTFDGDVIHFIKETDADVGTAFITEMI